MRVTIDLPLMGLGGDRNYACVPAEIVHDIAPHLAGVATFAVHENVDRLFGGGEWRVSNVETGARLAACDAATRAEAIRRARVCLAGKTVAEVAAKLEAARAKETACA